MVIQRNRATRLIKFLILLDAIEAGQWVLVKHLVEDGYWYRGAINLVHAGFIETTHQGDEPVVRINRFPVGKVARL